MVVPRFHSKMVGLAGSNVVTLDCYGDTAFVVGKGGNAQMDVVPVGVEVAEVEAGMKCPVGASPGWLEAVEFVNKGSGEEDGRDYGCHVCCKTALDDGTAAEVEVEVEAQVLSMDGKAVMKIGSHAILTEKIDGFGPLIHHPVPDCGTSNRALYSAENCYALVEEEVVVVVQKRIQIL
jgi:hypothetical protein